MEPTTLKERTTMRIQDIMSRDIKTIAPGAEVAAARNAMRTNGIRHLVVVDGRDVVGVVSERDLGGRLPAAAGKRTTGLTVADVMSAGVVSAKPETTVRQAANLLRGFVIGSLVVQEGGKPVGIVTITDLLDLIGRGAERPIAKSTRWTLRARGPRRSRPVQRMLRS
jgi:CBS domain-containing protein